VSEGQYQDPCSSECPLTCHRCGQFGHGQPHWACCSGGSAKHSERQITGAGSLKEGRAIACFCSPFETREVNRASPSTNAYGILKFIFLNLVQRSCQEPLKIMNPSRTWHGFNSFSFAKPSDNEGTASHSSYTDDSMVDVQCGCSHHLGSRRYIAGSLGREQMGLNHDSEPVE